eukprot:7048039-Prorocentrum_lima.AAC.1
MTAIKLIRKWAEDNGSDEFYKVYMELHTDWDQATAELEKIKDRETDQAYENAKQIEDTPNIAVARKGREDLLIR